MKLDNLIQGKNERAWRRYERETGKTGLQDRPNPFSLIFWLLAVVLFVVSIFVDAGTRVGLAVIAGAFILLSLVVQFKGSGRVDRRREQERKLSDQAPKPTQSEQRRDRQKKKYDENKVQRGQRTKETREAFLKHRGKFGEYVGGLSDKQTIIERYSAYINKHGLMDSAVASMNLRIADPKKFEIELLKMLIHYGEKHLQGELNALVNGEAEPRPTETAEEPETAEERERRVERDAWFESELAKEVHDRQSLRQKIKKEKDKILSQLEKKEISRAEALQTIDDLEKAEQRILKKLEMKGMTD